MPKNTEPATRPGVGMSRMALIILLIVIPMVGVISGAYWYFTVTDFQSLALDWIKLQRTKGWRIDYADVTRAGFPFQARLAFDKASIGAPPEQATWWWSADRLDAAIMLLDPQTLHLRALGDQSLVLPIGGGGRRYAGKAGEMTAEVDPSGWLPAGSLTVRGLIMTPERPEGRFAVESLIVTAQGDPATVTGDSPFSYSMRSEGTGISLPAELQSPLGARVDRLAVEAKLMGALAAQPWPESLFRWRDSGGTLELNKVAFSYGALSGDASGTIALDKRGQPIAALSAQVQGLSETIAELQQRQIIDRDAAAAAATILSLITRQGDDGRRQLNIPLTIQDQTLFVGPMAIARLPAVEW